MFENIFLAQELIRGYNMKRNSLSCMIIVDLCKAYDTICWDFLREVLTDLCFPALFIRWVMECVCPLLPSRLLLMAIYRKHPQ